MGIVERLKERDLIDNITSQNLEKHLSQPRKFYFGIDPTSDSLHIGTLTLISMSRWLQKEGHTPVIVIGGGTARIGDPSGKQKERPLLPGETIEHNARQLTKQVKELLLPFPSVEVVNNYDWLREMTFLHFLRDIGKCARLGPMLVRESVATRLTSGEGMSFAEFSYSLLQGYDFVHLSKHHGVTLQLGGSDQWGNIVAGIELIKKQTQQVCYGMTTPLLLKRDGQKFGKTAEGTLWLSKGKISPYAFYQGLWNVHDEEVVTYLKRLTEISVVGDPQEARALLANSLTQQLFGREEWNRVMQGIDAARPGTGMGKEISSERLEALRDVVPSHEVSPGVALLDALVETGILKSKGEGRRLIQNKGLYLNEEPVEDADLLLEGAYWKGQFCLVGVGKKKKHLFISPSSVSPK